MSDEIKIKIDGKDIKATRGQTIMDAAREAGVYIPGLCFHPELKPHGSCRVCTVKVNGKAFAAACTTPAEDGMDIANESDPELTDMRKSLIEMLFVEGNHYCMICEKSGNCELQAMGYRFGMTGPRYPYLWPDRELDMTHPDIMLDRNRCILCARCVQTSRDLDGKHVFDFVERGSKKVIAVNADARLSDTDADVTDKMVGVCPVGSIHVKDTAFRIPVGKRLFDKAPIGLDYKYETPKSAAGGSK